MSSSSPPSISGHFAVCFLFLISSRCIAVVHATGTPLQAPNAESTRRIDDPYSDFGGLKPFHKKMSPVPSYGNNDGEDMSSQVYASHAPSLSPSSSSIGLMGTKSHPNDILASMRNSGVMLPTIGKYCNNRFDLQQRGLNYVKRWLLYEGGFFVPSTFGTLLMFPPPLHLLYYLEMSSSAPEQSCSSICHAPVKYCEFCNFRYIAITENVQLAPAAAAC